MWKKTDIKFFHVFPADDEAPCDIKMPDMM